MNWNQFKDSVSDMCLAGNVVGPSFLTQEHVTVMTNIFVTELGEII